MKIYHVTASGRLFENMKSAPCALHYASREEWHLFHWRARLARKRLETSVRFELESCRLEALMQYPELDVRTDVSSGCSHKRLSW